ncbi:MAG: sigma-54 dependent transcriptional regulator [Myxococcota bacterium]
MARILVVDDEEGIRSFIGEVLADEGHDVALAADGKVALELLAKASYHLLVTDLKMPKVDGMTLLRRVRAEHPEMEAIVLTAHATVEGAVEAMKLGAFDYLQKPIASPTELRLLVARALERRGLKDRAEGASGPDAEPLTWGDPAMTSVVAAIGKVARTDATVLLVGESGTGKEVVARALHRQSKRAAGPFVAVNCAALSDHLLESELFGHEKGAFTGAVQRRRGRIELAEGGTFFLDEIGELAPPLQAKLLRVLQERVFERVGGTQVLTADVRWIAATNRDLAAEMAAGRFREDLYHRLAVFPVRLPPLRERRQDLLPLADHLLVRVGRSVGRPGLTLDAPARDAIAAHDWPGNVREMRNVLAYAYAIGDGPVLELGDLPPELTDRELGPLTELAALEIAADRHNQVRAAPSAPGASPAATSDAAPDPSAGERIARALELTRGNRAKAAELLGMSRVTLWRRMRDLGPGVRR